MSEESKQPSQTPHESVPAPDLPPTEARRAQIRISPKFWLITAVLFAVATLPLHWIRGSIEKSQIQNRGKDTQIMPDLLDPITKEPIRIYRGATALFDQDTTRVLNGSYPWRLLRWGIIFGDTETTFQNALTTIGCSESLAYLLDISNPPPVGVFCLLLVVAALGWLSARPHQIKLQAGPVAEKGGS